MCNLRELNLFKEAGLLYSIDIAVVVTPLQHNKLPKGDSPLLVFVNPKSGELKGRELLYGFRKLLNPHQVFDMTNGGPLSG